MEGPRWGAVLQSLSSLSSRSHFEQELFHQPLRIRYLRLYLWARDTAMNEHNTVESVHGGYPNLLSDNLIIRIVSLTNVLLFGQGVKW